MSGVFGKNGRHGNWLLNNPCQHTFHCQCLTKWKDDTCPVCRYSHNIANERVRRSTNRLTVKYSRHINRYPAFTITRATATAKHAQMPSLLESEFNDDDDIDDDDAGEICMECDGLKIVDLSNLWEYRLQQVCARATFSKTFC